MATLGTFVPVSAVFPATAPDVATYHRLLGELSRTDVLFWCARLNHVLTNPSELTHLQRQSFGVRQFFTPEQVDLIDGFAARHGGADTVTVFFRGQLLEIVRWAALVCRDHSNDGVTFEDPEVRQTFGKVALIASDIWGNRVYGRALTLDDGITAARKRSIGPFRKGVEGALQALDLSHCLGRGWELFHELMPAIEPCFLGRFQSATGLTIEDYYGCWCALATEFMKPRSEPIIFHADTLGNSTKDRPLVQRFVSLESQTVEELRRSLWGDAQLETIVAEPSATYEYKPLRDKPLLRASDGRMIIMDPIFMALPAF